MIDSESEHAEMCRLKQNLRALGVALDPNTAVGSPSVLQKALAAKQGANAAIVRFSIAKEDEGEKVAKKAVRAPPKPIGALLFRSLPFPCLHGC